MMKQPFMRNLLYYWLAALAYARGWFGAKLPANVESCTTGLNGKGEARSMYVMHNWKPYSYRRIKGTPGFSRSFITEQSWS